MQEFSMVHGYTENPGGPQNCQNWGVGICAGMGTCPGQYTYVESGPMHWSYSNHSIGYFYWVIIAMYVMPTALLWVLQLTLTSSKYTTCNKVGFICSPLELKVAITNTPKVNFKITFSMTLAASGIFMAFLIDLVLLKSVTDDLGLARNSVL